MESKLQVSLQGLSRVNSIIIFVFAWGGICGLTRDCWGVKAITKAKKRRKPIQ